MKILEGNNLKDNYERFLFHNEFCFSSLEIIVDDWDPKYKEYSNFRNFLASFIKYFNEQSATFFPKNRMEDLKSILEKKYSLYAKIKPQTDT